MADEKNLEALLEDYCKIQVNELKNSALFKELVKINNENGNLTKLNFGKGIDSYSNNYYINLEILNANEKLIETYNGNLTTSCCLITKDKKNRYEFLNWNDDNEFLDDIRWIIKESSNL